MRAEPVARFRVREACPLREDAVARAKVVDLGADLLDDTRGLVPGEVRVLRDALGPAIAVRQEPPLGPLADARADGSDPHVARADVGELHRADLDLVRRREDDGGHALSHSGLLPGVDA